MSVSGECVILGGGGESTSNSDDDEFDLLRECDWLLDRLLDLDFVRVTLKFEGESHEMRDFAR